MPCKLKNPEFVSYEVAEISNELGSFEMTVASVAVIVIVSPGAKLQPSTAGIVFA